MSLNKAKLDVKRKSKAKTEEEEIPEEPKPVSAGAVDKIVDYVFNPTREKIREVTSVDRIQARLLPQLDVVELMWKYVIDIAEYRKNVTTYCIKNAEDAEHFASLCKEKKKKQPVSINIIDEFVYRTAQWQKSIGGMNLKSAIDLALAETETRANDEGDIIDFDEG